MAVTCDNASNNDRMIKEMGRRLAAFEGQYSHVRCFCHIINLIAKAMLAQFDVRGADKPDEDADEDVRALLKLAEDLSVEEAETRRELEAENGEVDIEDDKEWVDEVATMDDFERDEFEEEVRPVKMVLVKVRGKCLGLCV